MFQSIHKRTNPPSNKKNKPKMALQVHIRSPRFDSLTRRTAPGTRQGPPQPPAEAFPLPAASPLTASLTVEAALVLPLFLFAMYLLILPLRMMTTARELQQICESVCQEAVRLNYIKSLASAGSPGEGTEGTAGSSGDDTEGSGDTAEQSAGSVSPDSGGLGASLSGNAIGAFACARAKLTVHDDYVTHLLPLRSKYLADGETITVTLDYDYRLPFSLFGLGSLHQSVTASRRAWIGRAQSGLSAGTAEEADAEDEIVYVGKSSTRYHSSPSCHYLSNSLTQVPFSSLADLRNAGGGKYAPCARCARGVRDGTVYVSPSGGAYHSDPDCSSLRAYARAVRRSEVAHLGPCSYCYR